MVFVICCELIIYWEQKPNPSSFRFEDSCSDFYFFRQQMKTNKIYGFIEIYVKETLLKLIDLKIKKVNSSGIFRENFEV